MQPSASSSTSPKPSSPPPAYSELPQTSPHPSQQPVLVQPVPQGGYGPTPIAQQTFLLPYYDPRSVYSMEEADSRARKRIVMAYIWALIILVLVGVVMGSEAQIPTGDWYVRWSSH